MHVANLESGSVTGQTAGTKGGKTSLMRQLTERIVLIHKLGQLGGTEELLHGSLYRFDVDQHLGGDLVRIMGGHSLTDHSLQSGQTDAVLVLQQFSHCTDTSVAQMVDIVIIADTVLQMDIIINGSKDIFLRNMLRNQFVYILVDRFRQHLRIVAVLLQDLLQHGIINQLRDAQFPGIAVHEVSDVYHHIGENLHILLFRLDPYKRNRSILNGVSHLRGNLLARFGQHFTRGHIHHVLRQNVVSDPVAEH